MSNARKSAQIGRFLRVGAFFRHWNVGKGGHVQSAKVDREARQNVSDMNQLCRL